MVKVAAIQLTSTANVTDNMVAVSTAVTQAAAQDAKLVVLPENFALMSANKDERLAVQEAVGDGPIQATLSELAKQHQITLIGGSLPTRSPDPERVYATSVVYGTDGELLAHYHKIHLFDVIVSDTEKHVESELVYPGDTPVVVETEVGIIGLSICYDLRFPELYRQLLQQGANILVIPGAFTKLTGQAHWDVLCRARAIENLCYLIGANQCGQHYKNRSTYGHSMIVDFWGEVLAQCTEQPGVITAEIDRNAMLTKRELFPALQHRRL